MDIFDKLSNGSSGGSAETCPWCSTSLIGADKGGWADGRFECPNCEGGVFFMEDGQLVDSMQRSKSSGGGTCEMCQSSLSGGVSYLPYEDGSNSLAYIKCPSCGHENVRAGFGEDD
nr:hypothetical protein OG296_18545 [Streptomyces sp. NBC_01001]